VAVIHEFYRKGDKHEHMSQLFPVTLTAADVTVEGQQQQQNSNRDKDV
jgi:hypothetical protein